MKNYLLLIIFLIGHLAAQQYYSAPQKKILSRRAAITDAYRQLAETIKGVRISSSTTVKDFVTQNDAISAKLTVTVVRGAQVTATRYMPDGTCEVDVIINISDLILFLQMEQNRHEFSGWKRVDFNDIYRFHKTRFIKATGTGAPPGDISQNQYDELQTSSKGMRDKIAKLLERIRILNRELQKARGTQAQFSKVLMDNRKLREQIYLLNHKLQRYQAKLQETYKQLAVWRSYKMKYEKLLNSTRLHQHEVNRLKNMIHTYHQYRKKYEESIATITNLNRQLQDLKFRLGGFRNYRQKYERTLQENQIVDIQLQKAEEKLAVTQKLYDNYQNKYKVTQEEKRTYLGKLSQLEQKLVELRQKLADSRKTQRENQQQYQQMVGVNQNLELQLEDLRKKFTKYEQNQADYDHLVNQNKLLLSQNQAFKKQMQQMKLKLQGLQSMFSHYSEYKAKYEEYVNKYKEVFDQLKNTQGQANQMFELRQKIVATNKFNQELLVKNRALRAEIANLKIQIETLKSQPTGKWGLDPRKKLMARRAAILDGYRQLYESIKGIRIDGRTKVKDFVTQKDIIRGEIQGFLKGTQILSTRYLPDGTCEVDMVLNVNHFIKFLHRTSVKHRWKRWKKRFSRRRFPMHIRRKIIKVTGTGAMD